MFKAVIYIIIILAVIAGAYLIVKETAQAPSPLPPVENTSNFIGPPGNPPTSSLPSEPLSPSFGTSTK